MSFVQDIVNGVTGNLTTDLGKWLARQTSNLKRIRALEKRLNPDQLHSQTQNLLAEALAEGLRELPDFDLISWQPIVTHPENRLQLIGWALGWQEEVDPTLGEWSLEHAPNPEALRGLLLRLHRLIQAKKSKYFSPEFFNLLDFLKEGHEETQETLERLEQRVVEVLHDQHQYLSVLTSQQEVLHTETQHVLTSAVRNLRTELFARLPPDDIEASPLVQEKIAHARVDTARDLLQAGQARAAQHLLERLRDDIAQQPSSPNLQFRIATNLGCCALHLYDLTTAKAEFSLAHTLQRDQPKALTNLAQVALLNNEPHEALRLSTLARQREPCNPHSTSLYLQALYEADQNEQLEQLLCDEPWIMQNVSCCAVVGQIRYHAGRDQEAEGFLRVALQEEPQNFQLLMLLAQAIIGPLQQVLRDDPPLAWRIPEETRRRFSEAEGLFTRAIQALEHFDNRRPLHTALSNRAATRIMLGVWDEALKDCDRVLTEDPTHGPAQLHKGLALLQLDKPTDAARCFEHIQTQEEIEASILPCAHAYYESNQPDKVIALLHPQWRPLPEDHKQLFIAHLLLKAYDEVNNAPAQEAILQTLATTWPYDPDALSMAALQYNKTGRRDEAIRLLQEALMYASTSSQRERIALELANCYYTQKRYAEAAQELAPIVDLSLDCPIAEKYLVALYNAGAYREALQVAQRLRDSGLQRPLVVEIEAGVLEYIGDLKQARSLYAHLCCLEPTKITHRVHLASLDFRRGEREAARQTLLQLRFEDIQDNAHALIQVAQLRAFLEMGGVLPLAYQARRIDFGNPQTHLAYFSLFLGREDRDAVLLNPCEIGIDCTVSLQRGNEKRSFTLLDEVMIPHDQSELARTDALTEKLCGHRKGDQIVFKSGLEDLIYEVIDVQSRYVAAFQETCAGFTTRFPEHRAFHRVEFQENDLSKIFTVIDTHHEQITQLKKLYIREQWPLAGIAQLVGRSLLDVWAGMVNQTDGRVIASGGGAEERRKERDTLASTNEVVLDLTAILTLWHLKLHERLTGWFHKIFVAQAVLDEVNKEIAWQYLGGQPSGAIGKEGDRYIAHEFSPELLRRQKQFLENLRDFIESTMEVIPVTYALEIGTEEFDSLKDLVSEGPIASVLIAKGRGVPLYSDDFGLRQMAKKDWQVEGIWSQTILVKMREERLLTDDEYHEAIRWLALAHYHFISIDATNLLWLLQKNAMQITEEITCVFALLQGPECDETSSVDVFANLIQAVWLEQVIDLQRLSILDLIMNTLITGRDSRRVVAKLIVALRRKFLLLPLQHENILQNVKLWCTQKLL